MWRVVRRVLNGFVALVVFGVIGGGVYQWLATRRDLSATPPPGAMVDVGGHRLHIWCKGTGTPAVVFDAGLGDTGFVWNTVHEPVAAFTRSCVYDRAGVGYSEAGPTPRSASQIATELGTLLNRAGIDSPVILVGASLGGFNVRLFESKYPGRTAGLVLVDATSENGSATPLPQFASLVPLAGGIGILRLLHVNLGADPDTAPQPVRRFEQATAFTTTRYRALRDELAAMPASIAEVRAARRPLHIPLVVVTSGRNNRNPQWREQQTQQVELSDRGCQVIADGSGHVVAHDNPQLVAQVIRATIASVRTQDRVPCDLM